MLTRSPAAPVPSEESIPDAVPSHEEPAGPVGSTAPAKSDFVDHHTAPAISDALVSPCKSWPVFSPLEIRGRGCGQATADSSNCRYPAD